MTLRCSFCYSIQRECSFATDRNNRSIALSSFGINVHRSVQSLWTKQLRLATEGFNKMSYHEDGIVAIAILFKFSSKMLFGRIGTTKLFEQMKLYVSVKPGETTTIVWSWSDRRCPFSSSQCFLEYCNSYAAVVPLTFKFTFTFSSRF